jgi:hypothetical protein
MTGMGSWAGAITGGGAYIGAGAGACAKAGSAAPRSDARAVMEMRESLRVMFDFLLSVDEMSLATDFDAVMCPTSTHMSNF